MSRRVAHGFLTHAVRQRIGTDHVKTMCGRLVTSAFASEASSSVQCKQCLSIEAKRKRDDIKRMRGR